MSQDSGPGPAEPSDMIAVHRALSGAIKSAPHLVGGAPPGDTDRSTLVGSYYDNMLRFLEVHHTGEDELLTPVLEGRCGDDDAALVRRIADQHHEVYGPIHDADDALRAWAPSADPAAGEDLVRALGRLDAALEPHLRDEETYILPLVAAHMTAPEWGALAEHGMKSFSGDNLWLILGLIRESMTEEHRAAMLTRMPPPLAAAWRDTGSAAFEAFIGEVRGSR